MSTPKDGGPAFPQSLERDVHGNLVTPADLHPTELVCGMSLRDWFAGQALCGYLADPNTSSRYAARVAYRVADQMLKEREKGHK